MPGVGHGSIPEGITIQEIMRQGPISCCNGEETSANSSGGKLQVM